jgi:hypothetical protein
MALTLLRPRPLRRLGAMKDNISKGEIRKDAIQDGVEAATHAVGQAANIVVGAVSGIAKTVGGLATDLFEIREAAKRAAQDVPVASTTVTAAVPVQDVAPGVAPEVAPDETA